MRVFKSLLSCCVLTALPAAAATYSFNNGSSSTANGITDSLGDAFRGGTTDGQIFTGVDTWSNWTSAGPGVVAFGIFNTDLLLGLQKNDLIAAFTNQFGSSLPFGAGPGGQRGTFSINPPQFAITASAFAGQFMYMFAGNGVDLANSTEFLVLKSGTQFLASDDAIFSAIDVQFLSSNTTTLFGTAVTNVPTTNTDATTTAGWSMAAPIPEPSSFLLSSLGVLALLRRRR